MSTRREPRRGVASERPPRRGDGAAQRGSGRMRPGRLSGPILVYAMALVRLKRSREARERLAEAMKVYPNRPGFAHAMARLLAAAPDDRVCRDGKAALGNRRTAGQDPKDSGLGRDDGRGSAELGREREAISWQREAIAAAETSRTFRDDNRRHGRKPETLRTLTVPAARRGETTTPVRIRGRSQNERSGKGQRSGQSAFAVFLGGIEKPHSCTTVAET